MLSIVFNKTKPNIYQCEYSIMGNNDVDVIDFSFTNAVFPLDDYGMVYAKLESLDKSYVDKIELHEENSGHFLLPLLAKITANKVIRVQLSFESETQCGQTEIVEITLKNTIKVNEEIANNYPSALQELELKTKGVYSKKQHNFITYQFQLRDIEELNERMFHIPSKVRVLLTENTLKNSKLVSSRYIDKKQGNRITNFEIESGYYSMIQMLDELFAHDIGGYMSVKQANEYIDTADYHNWKINEQKNYGCLVYYVNKSTIINEYQRISHKIYNFSTHRGKNVAVIKLQFKFVKDFEQTSEATRWTGTMANVYLECIVFLFKHLDNALIIPRVKRF